MQTNKIDQGPILLFHANVFNGLSLLWTLYFAHSKWRRSRAHQLNGRHANFEDVPKKKVQNPFGHDPFFKTEIQLRAF